MPRLTLLILVLSQGLWEIGMMPGVALVDPAHPEYLLALRCVLFLELTAFCIEPGLALLIFVPVAWPVLLLGTLLPHIGGLIWLIILSCLGPAYRDLPAIPGHGQWWLGLVAVVFGTAAGIHLILGLAGRRRLVGGGPGPISAEAVSGRRSIGESAAADGFAEGRQGTEATDGVWTVGRSRDGVAADRGEGAGGPDLSVPTPWSAAWETWETIAVYLLPPVARRMFFPLSSLIACSVLAVGGLGSGLFTLSQEAAFVAFRDGYAVLPAGERPARLAASYDTSYAPMREWVALVAAPLPGQAVSGEFVSRMLRDPSPRVVQLAVQGCLAHPTRDKVGALLTFLATLPVRETEDERVQDIRPRLVRLPPGMLVPSLAASVPRVIELAGQALRDHPRLDEVGIEAWQEVLAQVRSVSPPDFRWLANRAPALTAAAGREWRRRREVGLMEGEGFLLGLLADGVGTLDASTIEAALHHLRGAPPLMEREAAERLLKRHRDMAWSLVPREEPAGEATGASTSRQILERLFQLPLLSPEQQAWFPGRRYMAEALPVRAALSLHCEVFLGRNVATWAVEIFDGLRRRPLGSCSLAGGNTIVCEGMPFGTVVLAVRVTLEPGRTQARETLWGTWNGEIEAGEALAIVPIPLVGGMRVREPVATDHPQREVPVVTSPVRFSWDMAMTAWKPQEFTVTIRPIPDDPSRVLTRRSAVTSADVVLRPGWYRFQVTASANGHLRGASCHTLAGPRMAPWNPRGAFELLHETWGVFRVVDRKADGSP